MKRSTEHILTTHTGSLPRPPELMETLRQRDRGESNGTPFADLVREAVRTSSGARPAPRRDGGQRRRGEQDRVFDLRQGDLDFQMPACVGPVSYRDLDAVRADIANLQAAVAASEVEDAFMTAASPGVISVFLANQHTPAMRSTSGRSPTR